MRRYFQPIFAVLFIVPDLSIAIAIAIKCLWDAPTRKYLFYFISSQAESCYLLITSFHPCSALIPLISTGSCRLLSFLSVIFSKVKISSHLSKQDSCAINKKLITSTLTSLPGSSCFARCFIIPRSASSSSSWWDGFTRWCSACCSREWRDQVPCLLRRTERLRNLTER